MANDTESVDDIAEKALSSIRNAVFSSYMLGYQDCAKKISQSWEVEGLKKRVAELEKIVEETKSELDRTKHYVIPIPV